MTDESGDVRETGEGPSAAFPPPTYPRAPPDEAKDKIFYGQTFKDDSFQYRYIVLPEEYKLKLDDFSDHHLMTYSELRDLGVVLQPGWQHCLFWRPPRQAPTFLVRRPLVTGRDNFLDPPNLVPDDTFQTIPAAKLGNSTHPYRPNTTEDQTSYRNGIRSVYDALDRLTKESID